MVGSSGVPQGPRRPPPPPPSPPWLTSRSQASVPSSQSYPHGHDADGDDHYHHHQHHQLGSSRTSAGVPEGKNTPLQSLARGVHSTSWPAYEAAASSSSVSTPSDPALLPTSSHPHKHSIPEGDGEGPPRTIHLVRRLFLKAQRSWSNLSTELIPISPSWRRPLPPTRISGTGEAPSSHKRSIAMTSSVTQSIPISIPRPPSSSDDRADKRKGSYGTSAGLTISPGKLASQKLSTSPISSLVQRASSYTPSDYQFGPYSQSPHWRAAPTNSILLRSKRDAEANDDGGPTEFLGSSSYNGLPPAPVVTHIPAVPADPAAQRRKERQERAKLREKEERERREREIRERELELANEIEEQEEKVWGIPKKAFYFGLGSVPGAINFNAQMAMMAGWGNGSGGQGDYVRTPNDFATRPTYKNRASSSSSSKRPASSRSSSFKRQPSSKRISAGANPSSVRAKPSRPLAKESDRASCSGGESVKFYSSSINSGAAEDSDESEGDVMDPEELAALNAIINTRRSMAAAQALASGEVKLPAPKRPVRPDLAGLRAHSQETLATALSSTSDGLAAMGTGEEHSTACRPRPSYRRSESGDSQATPSDEQLPLVDRVGTGKIRFAPLPRPSPLTEQDDIFGGGRIQSDTTATDGVTEPSNDAPQISGSLASRDSIDIGDYNKEEGEGLESGDESESDYEDEDEAEKWRRRMKKYKGKWYLMGLPPQTFKGEYYRSWRLWSGDAAPQHSSPRPASVRSDREDTPADLDGIEQHRRLSTGSLMSVEETSRKAASDISDTAPSASPATLSKTSISAASESKSLHKRGRRGRLANQSAPRGSTIRSASAGSEADKEERLRRRQLILAARPGGTGMVTLPDGTKVRARRVGDADPEGDQEWGFAGLAKSHKSEAAEEVAQEGTEVDIIKAAEDKEDVEMPRAASPAGASSDATPRNTSPSGPERGVEMPKLSLQEKVRQRHEAEVAALGAEVLAAHRRRVGAAAANTSATSSETASAPLSASAAQPPESTVTTQPAPDAGRGAEVARVRNETVATRKEAILSSKSPRQPLSGLLHRRRGPSTSPSRPSRSPSRSSATSTAQVAPATSPPRARDRSRSKVSNSSSDRLAGSSTDLRSVDNNIALYSPMSSLPRKPDARGYAVVPLPSQLGVRPERPREGRVWEWSDDESSLESEQFEPAEVNDPDQREQGEEDEVTNMELDEDEMAEEEQRKVAHSKRATTTAAGLERMLVRTKSGATSTSLAPAVSRAGPPLVQRTRTLDGDLPSASLHDNSASERRVASAGVSGLNMKMSQLGSSSDRPDDNLGLRPARSSPSMARRSRSLSKKKGSRSPYGSRANDAPEEGQAMSSSTDDDLLWTHSVPDALGMGVSISRTTSHTSQNGSHSTVPPSTSPQLLGPPSYFALKPRTSMDLQSKRTTRKPSVERRSIERPNKKQAEEDEDAMDYGWPSSLKGSLYDR